MSQTVHCVKVDPALAEAVRSQPGLVTDLLFHGRVADRDRFAAAYSRFADIAEVLGAEPGSDLAALEELWSFKALHGPDGAQVLAGDVGAWLLEPSVVTQVANGLAEEGWGGPDAPERVAERLGAPFGADAVAEVAEAVRRAIDDSSQDLGAFYASAAEEGKAVVAALSE